MSSISRRDFVKGSIAATAGLTMAGSAWAQVRGANDDIRIGVAGIRSKGAHHIEHLRGLEGARVVAICDPDTNLLAREKKKFTDDQQTVETYTDVRKMLDSKDIDAIVIATPNHWHSLIGIWACQAGKDVYVEKPVSHNIWEGRQLVKAARKYDRIVQAGTQNRSDIGLIPMMQYIHEGSLGEIEYVHTLTYRRRKSIGKVPGPQPIPDHIDYDLWTGPAELQPLMRERLHYDWHWVWDYGNGSIGNQGIHEVDLAMWALQEDKLAPRVLSVGGRYGYDDDGETPNTMVSILDYESAPVICEVKNLPMNKNRNSMDYYRGIKTGIIIQCKDGYFAGGRGGGWIYDNDGNKIKQFRGDGGGNHQQNFIDAVRSRKRENLAAEIEKGHKSSALCHMAHYSYRMGQKSDPEKAQEAVGENSHAAKVWRRLEEHLFMNWIDLQKEGVVVGPWLEMDSKKETFVEKEDFGPAFWANKLGRGTYREPFVVPEKV
ncbi:Inositol 2-dehydrogenase [Anaerohalosphaera lusitana]|uniref:Inositol 2-dehydrogenase n=1 Tax=Anaerohalosphaera lusitana TaxID=1936003 RepID=A0A1U9NI74_9BACT|nr:Gfo/Idh/MocA family oxidoreductase [Anaerohalosphaera lusitana]AQT67424.1 Inositol 2-dehydrogenase [Anaerohalosphaera lusitana]